MTDIDMFKDMTYDTLNRQVDGTNYKRASNHANNNWGNIAGILFTGDNKTSKCFIDFIEWYMFQHPLLPNKLIFKKHPFIRMFCNI